MEMHSGKDTKMKAFFTIEASFIIPLTLLVFMLIIYFTFYLYNNCLLKQSIYIAEVRGQQLRNVSNSAIKGYIDEQLDMLLEEQVFQYQTCYSSEVSLVNIKVSGKSHIENRLSKFGVFEKKLLNSSGEKTVLRFYPAEFIRLNHRGR